MKNMKNIAKILKLLFKYGAIITAILTALEPVIDQVEQLGAKEDANR